MRFKGLLIIAALLFLFAGSVRAGEPGPYDMVIMAGEDFWMTALFKNTATGVPVNLTGDTYALQLRSAPAPAGILYANLSTSVSNPASGTVRATLSKAQTLALSSKSGVWDLLKRSAAGLVSYPLAGKWIVKPTTTRLP